MQIRAIMIKVAGLALGLAVATCVTPVMAKTTDFSAIKALLQKQDYAAAERRIDAILKAEPDNVNALMYKGNLVYYRNSGTSGVGQFYSNNDVSIYDDSIGSLGPASTLTTPKAARKVAVYFKRALAIAPQRMDIQMGLAWVYANAGMKDALIARFPEIRRYCSSHKGLQYNLGDYARVIADNYSFKDGMAVYRAIARLYPDDGNIANDMGAMYLKHRDLATAMKYFNEAAHKKIHDADTWQNLALLYTITGEYSRGLDAQKTLSRLHTDDNWVLYRALSDRLQGKPHWQDAVRAYARRHRGQDKKKYSAYVAFARAILPVHGATSPTQLAAALKLDVDTQLVVLEAAALVQEHPKSFDVSLQYADALSNYYNYRGALKVLNAIEQHKLPHTPEQMELVHFDEAWALYASGQREAANAKWKLLLDSHNFYRKSAAAYFLADYAYQHKDYIRVAAYCGKMRPNPSQSKYASYCARLYDEAKKKR